MDRWLKQMTAPALFALAALVAGAFNVGCAAQVIGGGGNGGNGGAGGSGGAGDGGNGGGRADECEEGDRRVCTHSCLTYGSSTSISSGTSGTPGPIYNADGYQDCELEDGHLVWGICMCESTPLVLSFERAPVAFAANAASHAFDLTGTGINLTTDWPTARTPWLALDRNGNGRIDDGGELFGSATVLGGGGRAENGFVALRELDTSGDGRITEADEAWSRLLLWSDHDGDRVSGRGELEQASSRRLLSIELGYTSSRRCDDRGNCEVERATFRYLDEAGVERTGDIIDVHLRAQ